MDFRNFNKINRTGGFLQYVPFFNTLKLKPLSKLYFYEKQFSTESF